MRRSERCGLWWDLSGWAVADDPTRMAVAATPAAISDANTVRLIVLLINHHEHYEHLAPPSHHPLPLVDRLNTLVEIGIGSERRV
jgi:hypothetical protein